MTPPLRPGATVPLLLLLAGCPGPEETPKASPVLVDANNYAFVGTLEVPSIETASATDVTIDWSAVVEDVQCHGLDPATDIDNVGMVRFGSLTQAEVADGLSTNNLDQAQMNGYVEIANTEEDTSANIAAMSFFGTVIDVPAEYYEGGGTYLLLLATGTTPGVGARMLAFLDPRAASSDTVAEVPNGCGVLDFDVDLASLTPVALSATGDWLLDWSGITQDGQGNDFDASGIDSVLLGYYEGATVEDLEANFLDIELNTTEKYTLALDGGSTADLAGAVDESGAAFPGFHDGGIWLLALRCSRCYNPAPPFISIVTPVY